MFNERIITLDDYLKKIDAVTKEEINTLVRKYLTTKTLNLAVVWSKGKEEKLRGLLKI